ncbi:MAG TPA: ChrR family anti-sigma-E factor [Xanthobacteraceae bacterium]|jgi:putative transcriptional regulator|nr:ChrR family anti-sigma-E factor [Xanthobacteraceae bacterium]
MTIIHHPSAATLAAFASGTLDEARAVVVASHLALCPQCQAERARFETVGGALLDAAPSAVMNEGAMERTLQRALATPDRAAPASTRPNAESRLPAPLEHYTLGNWRRIGGAVEFRAVDVPSDEAVRVFMLRAAPGTRLPRHRHTGTEWTCVFEGAFRHDLGRFGPGDFDEADESHEHNPVVEDGPSCICLVALEGSIKLQSLLGRLVQPFIRI